MKTFTVTVPFAEGCMEAIARVEQRLPDGFTVTASKKLTKMRVAVEVVGDGDVNDCWVQLTSFGMSPSNDLGSTWSGKEYM